MNKEWNCTADYIDNLDSDKDFECLLVPTNAQIETLYDKYADEITKPLNFEER